MNDRPELDLLIDIAKLVKKHGPESFEKLANYAHSSDFVEKFAGLLSISANVARKTRTTKKEKTKKETADSLGNTLAFLQKTEPRKYDLILDFYHDLQNKTVLPTMREIQSFVQDCGLPNIGANSRQKAILPLIKRLILLPTESLAIKLRMPRKYEKGDRSLEGWTNIILDKGRKTE